MNFSLWNFKEWFERQGIDLSYMISDNTASISMLSTADSASEGRLGCALVQPGEQLTDCTGFHTVLRFGSDRILFPVASPAEVLDAGAAMIEYYLDWENSLFDAITAGRSPEELVQLSQTVFPFPAAFFLPSGAPFFQTAGWSLPLNAQRIQPLAAKSLTGTALFPHAVSRTAAHLSLGSSVLEQFPARFADRL